MGDTNYWLCHTCREYAELGYGSYASDWESVATPYESAHTGHDTELTADPQGHVEKQYVRGMQPVGKWTFDEPERWDLGEAYRDVGTEAKV